MITAGALLSVFRGFLPGLDHMPDGGRRVDEQHPWAGEAHDGADALPHVGLVAVDLAVGAEGLGLHERAFVAAHAGVVFQFGAFRAEVCFLKPGCFSYRFVLFLTVEQDHVGDHLLLPLPFILNLIYIHQLILPFSTE